jgi:hypothetical protein
VSRRVAAIPAARMSSPAGRRMRNSRCCIPSGVASLACSAIVQQFLRGSSAGMPSTNARARRRGSTRRNREPTRSISYVATAMLDTSTLRRRRQPGRLQRLPDQRYFEQPGPKAEPQLGARRGTGAGVSEPFPSWLCIRGSSATARPTALMLVVARALVQADGGNIATGASGADAWPPAWTVAPCPASSRSRSGDGRQLIRRARPRSC